MLKIRRPLGRLIFNMGIAIPGKTVFLFETAPWCPKACLGSQRAHDAIITSSLRPNDVADVVLTQWRRYHCVITASCVRWDVPCVVIVFITFAGRPQSMWHRDLSTHRAAVCQGWNRSRTGTNQPKRTHRQLFHRQGACSDDCWGLLSCRSRGVWESPLHWVVSVYTGRRWWTEGRVQNPVNIWCDIIQMYTCWTHHS